MKPQTHRRAHPEPGDPRCSVRSPCTSPISPSAPAPRHRRGQHRRARRVGNYGRAIEASFQDQPFPDSAVASAVSAERGVRSYSLGSGPIHPTSSAPKNARDRRCALRRHDRRSWHGKSRAEIAACPGALRGRRVSCPTSSHGLEIGSLFRRPCSLPDTKPAELRGSDERVLTRVSRRGGTGICAGSAHGPAGTRAAARDHTAGSYRRHRRPWSTRLPPLPRRQRRAARRRRSGAACPGARRARGDAGWRIGLDRVTLQGPFRPRDGPPSPLPARIAPKAPGSSWLRSLIEATFAGAARSSGASTGNPEPKGRNRSGRAGNWVGLGEEPGSEMDLAAIERGGSEREPPPPGLAMSGFGCTQSNPRPACRDWPGVAMPEGLKRNAPARRPGRSQVLHRRSTLRCGSPSARCAAAAR